MDYEAGANVIAGIAGAAVAGNAIVADIAEISPPRVFYGLRPIPCTAVFVLIETNAVSAVSEKRQRVVSPQFFFA